MYYYVVGSTAVGGNSMRVFHLITGVSDIPAPQENRRSMSGNDSTPVEFIAADDSILNKTLGVMVNVVGMMLLGAWLQTSGRLDKNSSRGLCFRGQPCATRTLLQGTRSGEFPMSLTP